MQLRKENAMVVFWVGLLSENRFDHLTKETAFVTLSCVSPGT